MNKPDWPRAAELPPAELDAGLALDHDEIDDNPPASDAQLAAARPGSRRPGQRGPGRKPAKALLTLRIDPAALAAWRGSGEGWQARMNDLLVRNAPRPPGE